MLNEYVEFFLCVCLALGPGQMAVNQGLTFMELIVDLTVSFRS